MASCTVLVAKIMLGNPHHALAEQPIVRVRPNHCQIIELLRKRQRTTVSTGRGLVVVQAPESAQLVLGIAKALRDFQNLREYGAHLTSLKRRSAQRGEQPHTLARVQGPNTTKNTKC